MIVEFFYYQAFYSQAFKSVQVILLPITNGLLHMENSDQRRSDRSFISCSFESRWLREFLRLFRESKSNGVRTANGMSNLRHDAAFVAETQIAGVTIPE